MSEPHRSESHRVVIIGCGFAGIAMGVALKESGVEDFVILEQDDGVGGTWRANAYPGAACDIESHLYSLSYAPNPDWTRKFAPQPEILSYLETCVDKLGLRPHLRLGQRVSSARFDDRTLRWAVETEAGLRLSAQAVVAGCGGLSRPAFPDIKGCAQFQGKSFHSARWDPSYPLASKHVAVIGTGASAIQIVPAIASQVGRLSLFQRTAPWILPKPDGDIPAERRALFRRVPLAQRAYRSLLFWRHELLAVAFVQAPGLLTLLSRLVNRYIEQSVPDPVLRAKVQPRYHLGCKRVLLSNDYYAALQRRNVDVVCDAIREIDAHGVVTHNGRHDVDAIIYATGFQAAEAVAPFKLTGSGGRDLNEEWRQGPEAFLGTTITGFPNFFMIVGPNTGLGHSSMILMIEAQARYIASALDTLQKRGALACDVKQETQRRYNERLQARFPGTVWSSGCKSWYLTASGKNTTLWPGFTLEFRARTRRFSAHDYALLYEGDAREPAPSGLRLAVAPPIVES